MIHRSKRFMVLAISFGILLCLPRATVLAEPGSIRDEILPDAITDLSATLSDNDVVLNWTVPSDDVGVTSFRIYQRSTAGGEWTEMDHVLSGDLDTYIVEGVCGNPSINFLYDVRAEDAAGNVADQSNLGGEFDYITQDQPVGPAIAVTPSSVTVSVLSGGMVDEILTVFNAGNAVLTIEAVEGDMTWLTGEFASALPVSINPNTSSDLTVTVDAAALTPGTYEGVLSLGSNDPDDPVFPIAVTSDVTLPEMLPIPGGTFQMGSNSSWAQPSEQPVHEVTVSAFSMAKYEVTNEEMRQVLQWAYDHGLVDATNLTVWNTEGDVQELLQLGSSGWNEINFSDGTFIVDNGKEDHPCMLVSWYGAQAFCNYLSDMEGLNRCISFTDWSCDWNANGYRLPTEAEWEYACRAGTTTDYYSGDETAGGSEYDPNLDQIGWYTYNASWTEIVGQKEANDWGLKDMSGNVWEWCWNSWEVYPDTAQTNPTGPETPGWMVICRGGQFGAGAEWARSARRENVNPDGTLFTLGFRPARR